nr:hypothetical protein [Burkholderia stabilis]
MAEQEVPRFGYCRMSAWLALSESRARRMWSAALRGDVLADVVDSTTYDCHASLGPIRSGAATSWTTDWWMAGR